MLVRLLAAIAFFIGVAALAPARADITVVPDPDKWIQQGLKDIAQGKTDDFARNYLALIDKPNSFDQFAANLRVLQQFGAPVFMEKVVDEKYGGALREVIYLALYRQSDYVYFKFVMKKNSGGWLISDFAFKSNASDLFPPGFATPK
ncbi:MAG: hypothetical protein R3D52_01620 [Xanthobacteraceae bacterium]